MPSSTGSPKKSLALTSRRSRKPLLSLKLGHLTTRKNSRRPLAELSLNLDHQKSIQKQVQTIHQFCDAKNVAKDVAGQIKKGCNRILRLDENGNYSNLTDTYTIKFEFNKKNKKNNITTLNKVLGEGKYEITNLTSEETGTGKNILSLLHGTIKDDKNVDGTKIVVKISDLYKTYNNSDHLSAIYEELRGLDSNISKYVVALWGFINSVELQNEAAEIKIAPEIFDYFIYEKDGKTYSVIVMEKIEGRPINKSDNKEAIQTVLNELHITGIMHGDINPGNIIKVDGKDGEADKYMLIDFDMAQKSQQGKELHDSDKYVNTINLREIFESKVFGKTKKRKNKQQTRKIKRGKKRNTLL